MKKKLIIVFAIVLLLIIFSQLKGFIMGIINSKSANMTPVVELGKVKEETIIDRIESTGRIEAVHYVDVLPKVDGELKKKYFQEGDFVKAGQLLFLIEPDRYAIAASEAKASVSEAQATYDNAEKELKRTSELVKNDFVSKSFYDNALATRDKAKAGVDFAKANLASANLNYRYTHVVAPVSGKIGKVLITQGNLVGPQTGSLVRIVSTDPVYATFTLKSDDFIRFKTNAIKNDLSQMKVRLRLSDGSFYKEEGKISFTDNEVNKTTGTITLRATFPNKDNILVTGDYLVAECSAKNPRKVLTIPQEAVLESENGRYVYYVDENNIAKPKLITVNGEYKGSWIVTSGLENNDSFILKGLLKIKPNMPVSVAKEKEGK